MRDHEFSDFFFFEKDFRFSPVFFEFKNSGHSVTSFDSFFSSCHPFSFFSEKKMSEVFFENLDPSGIALAAGQLGSEVSDPEDAARNLCSLQTINEEGYDTDDDTLDEFDEEPISQPNSASPLEEHLPFGDDCGHNLDDCVAAVDCSLQRAGHGDPAGGAGGLLSRAL